MDPTMWMAPAGILILIVLMLRRSARHFARRKRDGKPLVHVPREQSAATTSIDSPADVARWEVHMHETARELSAQLDSKMAALQQLIRSANQQQTSLEEAMRRASQQQGETVPEGRPTMSNS